MMLRPGCVPIGYSSIPKRLNCSSSTTNYAATCWIWRRPWSVHPHHYETWGSTLTQTCPVEPRSSKQQCLAPQPCDIHVEYVAVRLQPFSSLWCCRWFLSVGLWQRSAIWSTPIPVSPSAICPPRCNEIDLRYDHVMPELACRCPRCRAAILIGYSTWSLKVRVQTPSSWYQHSADPAISIVHHWRSFVPSCRTSFIERLAWNCWCSTIAVFIQTNSQNSLVLSLLFLTISFRPVQSGPYNFVYFEEPIP